MKVRRLRNIRLVEDDTYLCEIEVFFEDQSSWGKINYVAKKGDPAETNQWIFEQLSSGKYKILDQRK